MNFLPYRFQLAAVRQLHAWDLRGLLALDMGLGKTGATLLCALRHPEARPVVVVCPAHVKWGWQDQAWKHFGWRTMVLETTKPPSTTAAQTGHNLFIINYEILHAWLDWLKEFNPRLVVIDECQKTRNPSTRNSKATRALCRGVPHVIALSGTPLVNRPIELWPTLNILRPDLFPSRWSFGHQFCGARRSPWGWTFNGATRTKELHGLLESTCMFRRRTEDVLAELPQKRQIVIPVEISNRPDYREADRDFLAWLRKHNITKLNAAQRAERLVQMTHLKRLTGEGKIQAVRDWVEDFLEGSDGKLVLFATHRQVVKEYHNRWKGQAVLVDGSTTGRKRQEAVERFQTSKSCRLLVGNLQAAGVGLNLQVAQDVCFAEYGWSPADQLQAEKRVHRIGSDRPVRAWHLVAKDTIEEHILKLNQDKQDVVGRVLDGEGGEQLNIYDQLCAMILERGNR